VYSGEYDVCDVARFDSNFNGRRFDSHRGQA
jgi:hypothetical protein